ncbi:phage associated protein [Bergeriella denitrificans]|uniref:Phage associated protein n=2 Tax=Bergeriella denitrificans TaxID=494 RepID=A0A378UIX2_BERDE|nr:phage associated protein [Bergeriella denitrificans]STZ83007.1 phage associated protein [Bergeriella denitrificans]
MDEWKLLFTHTGILFAMIGSVVGSFHSAKTQDDGWRRTLMEIIIGIYAAAAIAERYLPDVGVWQCGLAGVGAGLITGYALEAFDAVAPKAVRNILSGVFARLADMLGTLAGRK